MHVKYITKNGYTVGTKYNTCYEDFLLFVTGLAVTVGVGVLVVFTR
jgi:hypothetical protein